jgi:hypothetical protein
MRNWRDQPPAGDNLHYRSDKPYKNATDMIIYGLGGAMFWTGHPDRPPVRLGGTVISYQVGVMAALATMTALYGAEKGLVNGRYFRFRDDPRPYRSRRD